MAEHPEESNEMLDLDALDWPTAEPPAAFAERTAAAFVAESEPRESEDGANEPAEAPAPTPSRGRGLVLAFASGAVAVAAAVTLWMAWPAAGTAQSDSITTAERQTVRMGDRAVAVAEAGTSLQWAVDADGAAVVQQASGSVFYRVERGGAFEVKTSVGTVTVTGTCFEVETQPMRQRSGLKAATLGAALAGAVVVTVYEGGVVLANDRGEVALQPGQRASIAAETAPRRLAADDGADVVAAAAEPEATDGDGAVAQIRRQERALERARAEQLAQEKQIEALRKQVTSLGGEPGKLSPAEVKMRARKCAVQGRGGDCPFMDPDADTLREMARCGAVKVDFPGFLDNVESPEVGSYARSLGLTNPQEIEGLQAAADAHYTEFNERLRAIFVQLGGDAEMSGDTSAATMKSFIADQVDRELMAEIQRRVAEERAGLREPPADLSQVSIEEQAFRLQAGLGNEFEAHLGEHLGEARAHELRRIKDGWPGSTSVNTLDCIDPE
ncbi:MAG: FecR domain-containing protein [Myxococcota bacterium]